MPALAIVLAVSACDRNPSRENFGFVFETGYGERVDTFESLVTKDMFLEPDTTIHLALTVAERDRIHAKIDEIGFFQLPDPCPAQDVHSASEPHTTMMLRVQTGTCSKELYWDTAFGADEATEDQWKSIYELIKLIRGVVESHPEYQALPEADGEYY